MPTVAITDYSFPDLELVPDYCIDEVADHTLAFILGTTRQVVPNTLHVRDGKWGLATPLDQLRTLLVNLGYEVHSEGMG